MIALLRGIVADLGDDYVVIDVGGVGYMVYAGRSVLGSFSGVGAEAHLFIETHIREDYIHLYGFLSVEERSAFRLLGTVQGVGAKVALAICNVLSASDLALALASGDKAALCKASGVGERLANRIITELKDKYDSLGGLGSGAVGDTSTVAISAENQMQNDTLSALLNLGYDKSQAYKAMQKVLQASDGDISTEECIRLSLQNLASDSPLR